MAGDEYTTRERIIGSVENYVMDLLVYDRKDDDELPPGVIEQAIWSGEVTIDEIVEAFRAALTDGVEPVED